MQDKDFDMQLKRMSGKGCGDRGEDNKGRLSPLLSFRGGTVFSGSA